MAVNRRNLVSVATINISKMFLAFLIEDSETDSDDELELIVISSAQRKIKPRQHVPVRIQNYFEVTVSGYTEKEFQSHFRVTREAFETLLRLLKPFMKNNYSSGRPTKDIDKQLLAVLWLLATPDSYRYIF